MGQKKEETNYTMTLTLTERAVMRDNYVPEYSPFLFLVSGTYLPTTFLATQVYMPVSEVETLRISWTYGIPGSEARRIRI